MTPKVAFEAALAGRARAVSGIGVMIGRESRLFWIDDGFVHLVGVAVLRLVDVDSSDLGSDAIVGVGVLKVDEIFLRIFDLATKLEH